MTENHSLGDLFSGMSRGGGTGYLFPLLCYLVRQGWTSPRAFQFLHLAVAAAGAFAFARWAPLARRERLLFVFGYFPFYEYAVINRSYGATTLLVWLACAATRTRVPALALGAAVGGRLRASRPAGGLPAVKRRADNTRALRRLR